MTVYSLLTLAGAIFSFVAGCYIYFNNRKAQTNISFSLFCFALFVWLFGYTIAYTVADRQTALVFCRIACTGAMFTAPAFYHFTISFLEKKNEVKYVVLAYILTMMIAPLSLTSNLFLSGVYDYYWGYYSKAGFFHPFFLAMFFSLFFRGFYLLLKERRKEGMRPIRRLQIKYVFAAYVVALLGAIDYLPKYGIEIYPFGFVFEILFVLIVAYAIVRHKLMDIDVIIKKTLIFAGLFAVAFGVFAGFAYVGSIFFENVVNNRWIALLPSVFVIVLILRPLENFLRSVTDEFLFQKKYDYMHLLRTFAEEVLTVIEFNDLVHLTVNKLAEILKLENTLLFLYDEDGEQYQLAASVLPENSDKISIVLKENGTLTGYMRKRKKYFVLNGAGQKKKPPPNIMQELQKLETALVIPLTHHGDMVGILSLGKKKSDEEFSQDDIDVLLPLAKTLSIAITNATLFKELSKAQARAAQREKMAVIGTLSAGINHEICNPLGIARGQCEMFLLNIAEGVYKGKTQKELLAKAQEIMMKVIHETDRATLITRKLSSFAKPAKGEILDNVSLGKEVRVVISLLEHDLKLDNIVINKEIPEDLPNISADRKQLQEIFFNIIRNAVQSIKGAGKIFIRLSSNGKKVYVEIEDTGVGISKSELEQIFDPFFTTKDPGKGTGLGLYIVKQIIEKNNGKISVQSELGKGTTFLLTFDAI